VQWAGQKQHADGTATITSVEPTVKGKVKLNDSTEFDNPYKWRFSDKLHKKLQVDFKEFAGVAIWMWPMMAFQVFLEGYDAGKYYITLVISLIVTVACGIKMLNVNNVVTTDLLSAYDEKADGKFDDDDLEAIQCGRPSKAVEDKLKAIQPQFWFDKPELLLEACRFSLFLSALAAAELWFYPWQVGSSVTCFFQNDDHKKTDAGRPVVVAIIMCLMTLFQVFLLGSVTVPMVSVVIAIRRDIENPGDDHGHGGHGDDHGHGEHGDDHGHGHGHEHNNGHENGHGDTHGHSHEKAHKNEAHDEHSAPNAAELLAKVQKMEYDYKILSERAGKLEQELASVKKAGEGAAS